MTSNDAKICSVSEAKRMQSGHIIVNGMVAAVTAVEMKAVIAVKAAVMTE